VKGLEQVLQQAKDAINNLDLEAAISHLNLATVIDMNNLALWFHLGNVYYQNMQYRESIDCMRIVLDHAPDKSIARVSLADSLNRLGRFQEAIDAIEPAISYDECNLYGRLVLANSYLGQKKHLDAIVQYKMALRLKLPSADAIDLRYQKLQHKRAITGLIVAYGAIGNEEQKKAWLEKYKQI